MTEPGMPRRALVLLVILTLVWGTNWPLFAFAVREISVWTFRAVAVTLAGVTLLAVARARGQSLAIPREYWPTIVVATFFYLVFWNIASTYCGDPHPVGAGVGAGLHDAAVVGADLLGGAGRTARAAACCSACCSAAPRCCC